MNEIPFTPEQFLALLCNQQTAILQSTRQEFPEWIPKLPPHENVNLRGKNLASMDLRGVDFQNIDLSGVNLAGAHLDGGNLCGANLSGANLTKTSIKNTRFLGTRGLFGKNRAQFNSYQDDIGAGVESATFRRPGDHLPWSILRSITTLRIFGASYVLIIILVGYAGFVEWINDTAYRWAYSLPAKGEHTQHFRELLLSKIPLIEVAPHFGIQLLMVLCLAVGATIYECCCPDVIKENTESRWTRELNQSLIEYRAADASLPRARTVAFFFFGIGSL